MIHIGFHIADFFSLFVCLFVSVYFCEKKNYNMLLTVNLQIEEHYIDNNMLLTLLTYLWLTSVKTIMMG